MWFVRLLIADLWFQVIGAVVSYRPLLRNKGNLFVINLAIADICICCITCPMNMVGKFVCFISPDKARKGVIYAQKTDMFALVEISERTFTKVC